MSQIESIFFRQLMFMHFWLPYLLHQRLTRGISILPHRHFHIKTSGLSRNLPAWLSSSVNKEQEKAWETESSQTCRGDLIPSFFLGLLCYFRAVPGPANLTQRWYLLASWSEWFTNPNPTLLYLSSFFYTLLHIKVVVSVISITLKALNSHEEKNVLYSKGNSSSYELGFCNKQASVVK